MQGRSDVSGVYTGMQARALDISLEELELEKKAESGERFYMIMPRFYAVKTGLRIMLMFFVVIFACHSILFVPTPPLFFIAFRKYLTYSSYLAAMNVSKKKLNILLAVWIVICAVLNVIIWNYLEKIW